MAQVLVRCAKLCSAPCASARLGTVANFGHFRLLARIGQGGMAEVFRAEVESGPLAGRIVALKRLLPQYCSDTQYLDLFLNEADVTRQLRHPAIIQVLETGEVGDHYYIAMEFVEGVDLAKVLRIAVEREWPIPINLACYVMHVVADALGYAHRAQGPSGAPLGIVHCDVNPANIFISKGGGIRLGDFGVATNQVASSALLQGGVAGKAHYLAPEQLRQATVTAATDVFAVGVILYELLCGRRPFEGETLAALWNSIIAGRVTRPIDLRPEITTELERVMLAALRPRRASDSGLLRGLTRVLTRSPSRYDSADAFAADLKPLYDAGRVDLSVLREFMPG